jgi:hypothetical protein
VPDDLNTWLIRLWLRNKEKGKVQVRGVVHQDVDDHRPRTEGRSIDRAKGELPVGSLISPLEQAHRS